MKKLICILFLCVCFGLKAQPPAKWYTRVGGPGIDIGYGVKETFERKYIVAGSTSSFGTGAVDAYLILIDSMGQKIWERNYGGALSDVAKAVVVNPVDSGFVFTGYTNSIGNGGYDVFAVRTDKSGNLIWQRSYGGLDWDFGNDIIMGPDGNLLLCGYTFSKGYGKKDGYVLKIDITNGTLMWEKFYGGSNDDVLNSIIKTSDGLISLCGTKTSNGTENDFWLLKLTLNGDSVLSKSVTSFTSNEKCYDFIEDKVSELIFCGAIDTSVAMTGKYASYVFKTDLNGAFLSQATFTNGANPDERFHSLCNTKSDNTIALSRKITQNVFKLNCYIFKCDNNFSYIDSPTYGDTEDDELFNIENTSDDGYILTGYTKSFGAVSEDVFILKLSNDVQNSQSVIGIHENSELVHHNDLYYHKGSLHFSNSIENEVSANIYNAMGQLVYKNRTNGNTIATDIQVPGIYVVLLSQGAQTKKLKFIVDETHD
jgi:hypothetical protein